MSAAANDPLGRLLGGGDSLVERLGRVVRASGTAVHAIGLTAAIGQRCAIVSPDGRHELLADVVGIAEGELILFPLGPLHGVTNESLVRVLEEDRGIGFSERMVGLVIDAFGKPLNTDRELRFGTVLPLDAPSPPPMRRRAIAEVFETGVKVIDSLLSVGTGQRMGIFAMAGAGKSTLLSMLARHARADVIVIGLIGERGREVREFVEETIGAEGMRRSVVVVATSDRPAMERVMAAQAATAIAEGYRAAGKHVLLLMDSVTRYARALREVGLSAGELPVRRGFTPSVFAELPRLFERVGNDDRGSITAFYTVLAEDEDNSDPIAEETRSILDGHIVLSRELGEAGHYPAIDPLASVSRLFTALAGPEHRATALEARRLLARYREVEFLVRVGEYKVGSDALSDRAIEAHEALKAFLQQGAEESVPLERALAQLSAIVGTIGKGAAPGPAGSASPTAAPPAGRPAAAPAARPAGRPPSGSAERGAPAARPTRASRRDVGRGRAGAVERMKTEAKDA